MGLRRSPSSWCRHHWDQQLSPSSQTALPLSQIRLRLLCLQGQLPRRPPPASLLHRSRSLSSWAALQHFQILLGTLHP